jgi:hypothetical protein
MKENFIEWLDNVSDKDEVLDTLQLEGKEISPNVYDFYGSLCSGVKIDIDNLEGFGTFAGRLNNKCFTSEVVDYLKNCGVEYVISSIFLHEPTQLGHCLIKNLNSKECKVFSKMIEKNNGSLSFDGTVGDYHFFENE